MFSGADAARLAEGYQTPARLFAALQDLNDADRRTLAHTSLADLEQNVSLHTLNDHAPTALAPRTA